MNRSLLQLATSRRSVRRFSKKPVSMRDVIYALNTARQAPSGANGQPWRFIVVDDPDLKVRLREASEKGERSLYENVKGEFREWLLTHGLNPSKPFLEEAPLLVAVLMDTSTEYARESVWVAIAHILLALEERGLSTMTYTPSDTGLPLAELEAPLGFKLEAILPVGYSTDETPKEPKKAFEEIVFLNHWGDMLT